MAKTKPKTKLNPQATPEWRYHCEAEVVTGLKDYARAELLHLFGDRVHLLDKSKPEEIEFYYNGDLKALTGLNLSVAVYWLHHFEIPRPQALLGHQHFQTLLKQIQSIRSMNPAGSFNTFRISAAGSQSSVFQRIKEELAAETGLRYNEEEADLLLRIRKSDTHTTGWDVVTRITPRPLSARTWRVCDMLGALNATIAHAMVTMSDPRPNDRVLNLMCGSGTLLIERLRHSPAEVVGGCDTEPMALRCATQNIAAGGFTEQIDLFDMDATRLELPDDCIDVVFADLPWGQLVGSHESNQVLYPRVLKEAARVTVSGGRGLFITHEIRLVEQVLDQLSDLWRVKASTRVFQGGLHPRIYELERL